MSVASGTSSRRFAGDCSLEDKPSKKGWDESTDAYIRHRDGVIHVLSVRTGTVMDCPICGTEMKVPYMVTHYVHCPLCKMRGFTREVSRSCISPSGMR
jgi:hypothetical protein